MWPLGYFKMTAGHHLGFGPTGNNILRSADLKNDILETNTFPTYGHWKFSKWTPFGQFYPTGSSAVQSGDLKTLPWNETASGPEDPLRGLWPVEIFQCEVGRSTVISRYAGPLIVNIHTSYTDVCAMLEM